jgi:hypothetical protein
MTPPSTITKPPPVALVVAESVPESVGSVVAESVASVVAESVVSFVVEPPLPSAAVDPLASPLEVSLLSSPPVLAASSLSPHPVSERQATAIAGIIILKVNLIIFGVSVPP